jgi:glutamate-ammonia-ligase adenylyltransferase
VGLGARAAAGLADSISKVRAIEARARFVARWDELRLTASEDATELAALIACAYPALARDVFARPESLIAIARSGTKTARDVKSYKRAIATSLSGGLGDEQAVRRTLRIFAAREKLRIALRELLQHSGNDVDVTARELSDLADVCLEIALTEARAWAEARFGVPTTSAGERCMFSIIGMGKLGGRELNAGSDVDLLLFYETDDGDVRKDGRATEQTLHEHFARIAQRLTQTMEDATEDGIVWRVDLRLRPEGSRGALVNALAAAERYYETWGRTWERAALLRARHVAGDAEFGERVLDALAPFVWRRNVNPLIADEMMALAVRARTELATDPARDVKLGVGGIREAEFFVQSLQLIWGGREKAVRSANTLDALRRLRARGFVTDREGRELADAYLSLRRVEHRVQFATGLQTHSLPPPGDLLETIARSLGYGSGAELERDLDKTRRKVAARFQSIVRAARPKARTSSSETPAPEVVVIADYDKLYVAIDARDEAAVLAELAPRFGTSASPDLARHLLALARRPDFPLGAKARDDFPDLAPVLMEALDGAADPEQATRLLATFFARCPTPGVYERALAEDPRAARRLASLFGASAFLGEAMVGHPELVDRLLFGSGAPDPKSARAAVDEEVAALDPNDAGDPDSFVGALRRAKAGLTIEVGLADLAGDLSTRECTLALSEVADATLDHATRFAMREQGATETPTHVRGLVVVAMGKLGGREIGYGSDLDLFFVYDEDNANDDDEAQTRAIKRAQRVIRLVSTVHGDGAGYELDTRLRPSGNQGLLVVSLAAFARYHGFAFDASSSTNPPSLIPLQEIDGPPSRSRNSDAQDWERQALLKARPCAGDPVLGARVLQIAHAAAYEGATPSPEKLHHLRMRMERELAGERTESGRARYDLKLGRGGLVDVEFAVQWLQMKRGRDPRVRTTDTEAALDALEVCGYLDASLASSLREGYRTLRRLEQRLRVLHGTSAQLIEEGAPGLPLLARRMGMRDGPRATATERLMERYLAVTRDVRAAYLAILGIEGSS